MSTALCCQFPEEDSVHVLHKSHSPVWGQKNTCDMTGEARHLDESETMTVAAALDAETIFKSTGTSGDPYTLLISRDVMLRTIAGAVLADK